MKKHIFFLSVFFVLASCSSKLKPEDAQQIVLNGERENLPLMIQTMSTMGVDDITIDSLVCVQRGHPRGKTTIRAKPRWKKHLWLSKWTASSAVPLRKTMSNGNPTGTPPWPHTSPNAYSISCLSVYSPIYVWLDVSLFFLISDYQQENPYPYRANAKRE